MVRKKRVLWESFRLDYFRRLPTYRWSKRWLSVACAAIAALWIGLAGARDDQTIYSSGSMSPGHEQLADRCSVCHEVPYRGLTFLVDGRQKDLAMNEACLKCHGHRIGFHAESKTAVHQKTSSDSASGAAELACSSCHSEHEGFERLVLMSDQQCVRCHADLGSGFGDTEFHKTILSFDISLGDPERAHPDFRILTSPTRDPGRLKFSHHRHLDPEAYDELAGLRGPDGRKVNLKCDDCHRAGKSTRPWRFGKPGAHAERDDNVADSEPQLQAAYMRPIRYERHCAACHTLDAGAYPGRLEGIPDDDAVDVDNVPHHTPGGIRTYLRGQLTAQTDDSSAWDKIQKIRHSGLRRQAEKEWEELQKVEYINEHVEAIEKHLYADKNGKCQHCHEINVPAGSDPRPLHEIAKPDVPTRWLRHASFNHERHTTLSTVAALGEEESACLVCHQEAATSEQATDVMLPHIDMCRACHAPRAPAQIERPGGVSYGCVLCHTYHRPPQISGVPAEQ